MQQTSKHRAQAYAYLVLSSLALLSVTAHAQEPELIFKRLESNAPLFPLAYLQVKKYNTSEVETETGETIHYDQSTLSHGLIFPYLANKRDLLFFGEWGGASKLESERANNNAYTIYELAGLVGWIRQIDERWQSAAFVTPLATKTTLPNSDIDWKVMGGAFARYSETDNFWWATGLFFDVGGSTNSYYPYLGASWNINERWLLSAVIPWPAIIYAPNQSFMLRFGGSMASNTWSINEAGKTYSERLSGWDIGLSAEHRIYKNIWLKGELGYAGLRSFEITGDEFSTPDFDVNDNEYISIGINYRPEL